MQINVTTNFPQVMQYVEAVGKQGRFALALALTKTAGDVKREIRARMPQIIDRPKPYTLNSMYVRKATKAKLEAVVGFKDNYQTGPGEVSKHYLMPLIYGGKRRTKRFEGRLIMHGKLARGEQLVPTSFAKRDAYGNVSRGEIAKILSQLKTAVVHGDNSNASDSARSQAKRSREEYFWSPGPGGQVHYRRKNKFVLARAHLTRGVWKVVRTAFGNAVRPIFYAKKSTKYKRQFRMDKISEEVMGQRFPAHFSAAIQTAIRTAK